ncbi:MAG: hypothetical protein ACYC4K_04490 [Thiobacillus sp.]
MKIVKTALVFSMIASPVFAAAPSKPAPLFPDAPPPPQIAPASVAACCTDTGRFSRVDSSKDKSPIEGAACEANTADGFKPGTICY